MPLTPPAENATIAERIVYALDVREMSQTGLEQAAHLSRGYVSRMRRGERMKFSPDLLRRTADGLRVNYEWLATGRGDMEAVHAPAALPPAAAPKAEPPRPAPALETAIAYHRSKWSPAAIAAARALSTDDSAKDVAPDEWAAYLDQIEAALTKIKIVPKARG